MSIIFIIFSLHKFNKEKRGVSNNLTYLLDNFAIEILLGYTRIGPW